MTATGATEAGTVTDPLVDAVADAYVWGYPLLAVHRARTATTGADTDGARRGLVARRTLGSPEDRSVVAPNDDTLYASGFFDLAAGDLRVEVPAMDRPDRYWSVMLLDAYTHVSYLCRRLHGTAGTTAAVRWDPDGRPGDPSAARDRSSTETVTVPVATPTVWVLVRVLVEGPHDLAAAQRVLDGIRVVPSTSSNPAPAPIAVPGRRDPLGLLGALRRAVAADPPAPWHPAPPPALDDVLDGDLPVEVVRAGITVGHDRIRDHGPGPVRTGNGWRTRLRGAEFGDDATYRAAFARSSLAGHLPIENRSYHRVADGRVAEVVRFPAGGEPPVDGFWSLCVYGPDLFFVANELGRHSIGDRTPGLRREPDGALAVHVGAAEPPDPSNWLPAPPGPCVVVLRAYEGRPEVVDASWFPPEVLSAGAEP